MEETPTPPATVTLGGSIVNVFASPGEVFTDLRGKEPRTSLWIAPLLVSLLMVVLFSYVFSSNETFRGQLIEAQTKALQKAVEEGKITQQLADQQADRMQNMGSMFLVFGIVFGAIFAVVFFFGGGLFLWLGGKLVLKSPAAYGKYLEVYGISAWIGALGAIVTLMMMIGLNTMYASPSASLAVLSTYDFSSNTHKFLSALNVFSLWQTAVVGIGLAKLSEKSTGMAMGLVFGMWVVWVVAAVFLGIYR
ncbi:MAG: YIP1 family protein [Bacteroidota bacterium]